LGAAGLHHRGKATHSASTTPRTTKNFHGDSLVGRTIPDLSEISHPGANT
jgi:hypothetical protein